MKGCVDSTLGEIQAGDVVIDPMSGVLARVESVEPVNEKGIVTLHMRGSVSLGYMGITGKPDRPLRRAPRPDTVPVIVPSKMRSLHVPASPGGMCDCGKRLQRECADECVR